MFDIIMRRIAGGSQFIGNPRKAVLNPAARCGLEFLSGSCSKDTGACADCPAVCPVQAIEMPLAIDMGKCVLCGECVRACEKCKIVFSSNYKTATDSRKKLVKPGSQSGSEEGNGRLVEPRPDLRKILGRSLKLRSVSAGGCNGCEMELNACGNVNFDMGRYGIEFTASPRHADGLVISGPLTANMAAALADTYAAIPPPKLVVLFGACAISGGVFADSPELCRQFLSGLKIDLYVPGCPPHPLTLINGLLDLIGKRE